MVPLVACKEWQATKEFEGQLQNDGPSKSCDTLFDYGKYGYCDCGSYKVEKRRGRYFPYRKCDEACIHSWPIMPIGNIRQFIDFKTDILYRYLFL